MIDVIGNINYTKESFHDFIAHNINITVTFLLTSIDSTIQNEVCSPQMNEYIDKWNKNIALNAEQISLVFSDLKELIEKVRTFDAKEITFIVEIIDLYEKLYLSLLLIQENIITGLDDFE
ncbi:MAG: hypothetical protein K2G83_05720, partial [Ruminococcus sp.]|nr:hypothetical protein [Ruminococcus sp.]